MEILNVLLSEFWVCCSKWLSTWHSAKWVTAQEADVFFSELYPLSTSNKSTDDVIVIHLVPHILNYSLQSLWIERTTLTLTHSLPGISRWFEVERRELVTFIVLWLGFEMMSYWEHGIGSLKLLWLKSCHLKWWRLPMIKYVLFLPLKSKQLLNVTRGIMWGNMTV